MARSATIQWAQFLEMMAILLPCSSSRLRSQLAAARAEVAQLLGLLEESDAARARLQARVERLPPVSRSAVAAEGRRAGPVRLALRGTGVSGTGADEGSVDLPSERRRRVVPLPPGMKMPF